MIIFAYCPSNKLSNHDNCVAVVKDGELIYSYEEQKLSRVNHRESKYFPDRSALSALYTIKKKYDIDPRDIDIICVCGYPEVHDPLGVLLRLEKYYGISNIKIDIVSHHEFYMILWKLYEVKIS